MSVQGLQAPSPALRWTWYFLMLRSFGFVQVSSTQPLPLAAASPAGAARSLRATTVMTGERP